MPRQDILRYATAYFRAILGKGLPELHEKEIKAVAKALNKCSHEPWVAASLEYAFKYPANLQEWTANFESMETYLRRQQQEIAQRAYRERYA